MPACIVSLAAGAENVYAVAPAEVLVRALRRQRALTVELCTRRHWSGGIRPFVCAHQSRVVVRPAVF
jgi:hypothetical protein